ncbi:hypothetical protein AAG906_016658 [Vitis piasezkii]
MGIITKSAMVVALTTIDDAGTIHSNNSAVPSASGGDPMLDGDGVMEIWMLMWTSNNDCDIREHNMESFQLLSYFCFPWPVNHTSIRPDRKLATVVGNHLTWMAGRFPQQEGGKLYGRSSRLPFDSTQHPSGNIFATRTHNQTCLVWDARKGNPHCSSQRKLRCNAINMLLIRRAVHDGAYP